LTDRVVSLRSLLAFLGAAVVLGACSSGSGVPAGAGGNPPFVTPAPSTAPVVSAVATPTTAVTTSPPTTSPTTAAPTTAAPTTAARVEPGRVILVGDSVMAALDSNYTDAAREVLAPAGWDVDIDAEVNRSTVQGGRVLSAFGPRPQDTVVIMLGHNDAGSAKVFAPRVEEVLEGLADVRRVFWLTMREPRYATANTVLADAAAHHPNMHIIPWAASIAPGWTARDGLHLNGSGATGMAQLILKAISRP
jgi:lysophospholipase L1-like esterase